MSQPVTDPALIEQLNATLGGGRPVTDPGLLAQLNASLSPSGGDAEAQAGGFYGTMPITAQGRRQVQRRALAGLDPTEDQAAALAADKPRLDENTGRFVNAVAPVAAIPLMPVGAAGGLGMRLMQGATLGPATGYASGFLGGGSDAPTLGEHLANRHERGTTGAMWGAGLGVGLPLAIAGGGWVGGKIGDAIGPTVARYGTEISNRFRQPQPMSGGAAADVGRGPIISGAEAAADQTIANQLARANVSVPQLRNRLAEADEAAKFHTSGRAQQTLAPVDLDSSLQRLAGSAARQQPEAGNVARDFLSARQTGATPVGRLPVVGGVPTRPEFAQPITGAQAERTLGNRFNTADDNLVPMGQFERVKDALKRALLISDSKFHGHGATAYRTEQGIVAAARREADQLYGEAYKAGQNINLRPAIEPVMQRWAARASDPEELGPVRAAIRTGLSLYTVPAGPVSNLQRFDRAKRYLDGRIEKLFESVEGRNRELGGLLSEFQRDMLKAVDAVKVQGMGDKYAAARDAYGSRMEMRDALRAGRDVFREGSEVAVDQFRQLTTSGQQKLFRLGLLDGFEQHMGRQARSADVTRVFASPRIQEMLREVIPRTQTATGRARIVDGELAEFANRPERFGQYVANERAMIGTRDTVLGNSKTAERLADDQAFNTLSGIVEQMRHTPSVAALGMKAFEKAIDKLFGFRQDTAAFIAHKLFTANPAERVRLLQAIESRMGANRMEQFIRLMAEYQARIGQAGAVTGTAATASTP